MGNVPNYVRHVYKVERELKSYTIYVIDEVKGSKMLLTDLIRIETFRGKSNTHGIDVYLRLRDNSNWSKCSLVTGLRPISKEGVYYGDCNTPHVIGNEKKTLLLFRYSPCGKYLFIDVFSDFYPYEREQLYNLANSLN
jgi:hypothetical protein